MPSNPDPPDRQRRTLSVPEGVKNVIYQISCSEQRTMTRVITRSLQAYLNSRPELMKELQQGDPMILDALQ